jgi:nicotinate-nucleotide adenylyltransferase
VTQQAENSQRIGVLGGTFDPIHIGHLVTGVNVRHELSLDVVLFVVAHNPWQKADRDVTPSPERYAMVAAALEGRKGLEASDLEIERGGVSLTADTLTTLRERNPTAELFLIVGQDQAGNLDTWERVEEIKALATLVVVRRPGSEGEEPPRGWRVVEVEVPLLQVSSSDVRDRLARGCPVDWLVPDEVVRVARERGLYPSGG